MPRGVLKCRWCSKRLKWGSQVCHHCGRDQAGEQGPPDLNAEAVKEIAARLEAGGMRDKGERLRATVAAMELVHAGESVDAAVAAVSGN